MNDKIRKQLLEEIGDIEIFKSYDPKEDVDHLKCLEHLLYAKANPNMDLSRLAPKKPYPIFHAVKSNKDFLARLILVRI